MSPIGEIWCFFGGHFDVQICAVLKGDGDYQFGYCSWFLK